MIIDSDDDEAPPPPPPPTKGHLAAEEEKVEFEAEEPEWDPSKPWPNIVQHLDIAVGAGVVDICLPHLPPASHGGDEVPLLLRSKIVVAAACADSSVRVLALPLSPPSDAARKRASEPGHGGLVQEARLDAGPKGHCSPPNRVAFTWTSRALPDPQDGDWEGEEAWTRPLRATEWDLLLASASSDASGLLLMSRVAIDDRKQSIRAGHIHAFQRLHLSSPAADLAFNPAAYPLRRHAQLLVSEKSGAARIYSPFPPSRPRSRRRDSDASAMSALASPAHGTWLATFPAPFCFSSNPRSDVASPALSARKAILAARWICQGRGVILLMSDGEYGVWDFNKAAPPVLQPAAPTPTGSFALRGLVGSSTRPSSPGDEMKPPRGQGADLAPMTPKTRKVQEQRLFSSSSTTPSVTASTAPLGGITVIARKGSGDGVAHEDVLLWYAGEVYTISDIRAHWKRAIEDRDSAAPRSAFDRVVSRVEGLDSMGERITHVDQLPDAGSAQQDLVISAERRLLVLSKQRPGLVFDADEPSASEGALVRVEADDDDDEEEMADGFYGQTERQLLDSQDLGLGGINRMLDSIGGSRLGPSASRRVGFAAS